MWGRSTVYEEDCMTDGEVCKKESGVIDSGVISDFIEDPKEEPDCAGDSGVGLSSSSEVWREPETKLPVEVKVETVEKHSPTSILTWEDIFRADENGDTPLHQAVLQGFLEAVFAMVRIIPDHQLLDLPNCDLHTPLHLAVLTDQAPLVRRLVVAGAAVRSSDRHGNTPLHYAARNGMADCIKALCEQVTDSECKTAMLRRSVPDNNPPGRNSINNYNYEGETPLHLAAINGHSAVARLLCRYGANPDSIELKGGRTALHYATLQRSVDLMQCLVMQCCCSVDAEDYSGSTAFDYALSTKVPALPQLLVQLGSSGVARCDSSSDSGSEFDDED